MGAPLPSQTDDRLPGWEARLDAVIERARATPYRLGEHDCFSLACAVVHALTGRDRWSLWRGLYRTRRGALRLMRGVAPTFTEAFSIEFGTPSVGVGWARRGDLVQYVDPAGEPHLGVVLGARVAVLGESGLLFVSRGECVCAWRIG